MFELFKKNPKRITQKIISGKKEIILSFYFDKKGKEYYTQLNDEKQKLLLNSYEKLQELLILALKENNELIDSYKVKIEIKITKFVIDTNIARVESEKSNMNEMFFAIGVVYLLEEFPKNMIENTSNIQTTINHELTHVHDYNFTKNQDNIKNIFEKYKNSNLLPYNLIISLNYMKSEGLATWTELFFNSKEEYCFVGNFSNYKEEFRKKINYIQKSKEIYSAYELIGTTGYYLGLHMFFIITLANIKKRNKLHEFFLVDEKHNTYPAINFFLIDKITTIWFYPIPEKIFLRELYTGFRTFDEFQFIEQYYNAFLYLGFNKDNLIFTKDEIKIILNLKN